MKKLTLIYLLFIVAVCSRTHAKCRTEEDLRPVMGPIRDQKDKGWCYANVAADLLGFAHRAQLLDVPISSSFVAINYNYQEYVTKDNKPDEIFKNSGLINQAIKSVQKLHYVCPQSIDEKLIQGGLHVSLSKKFETFEMMYKFLKTQDKSPETESKKQAFITTLITNRSILSMYPRYKVDQAFNEPTMDKAVLKLIDLFCEDEKIEIPGNAQFNDFFLSENKSYDGNNGNLPTPKPIDMLEEINAALDKKVPAGISYDVGDITVPGQASGYHASIIVARKTFEDGSCKYLIRNSWGDSCDTFVLENNDVKKISQYKFPCVKGHIWVDEDLIKKSVKGVTRQK